MIVEVLATLLIGAQRPTMVVYQETVVEFTETDPNVLVSKKLCEILQREGKVAPVLWSTADPTVAAAITAGRLPTLPGSANRGDVLAISRTLGATYVSFVELRRLGAELIGKIEVLRVGGRSMWKTESRVSIMNNGRLDPDSGALSIANTWAVQLNTNPFKDLPTRPIFETPEPANPTIKHPSPASIDRAPFANGYKALEEGDLLTAVTLLRDAVDLEPFSVEARLAYIEALRRAGHPFLAADEGARAAALMPQEGRFLVEAADAWMLGGKPDRAFEIVTEALRQNPSNAAAHSLMGDLFVGRLELGRAVDAYTKSYSLKNDPETLYKRAQAHAIAGQFDLSVADIEQANTTGLSQEPEKAQARYRAAVKTIDPVIDSLALQTRNLLRQASDPPSATLSARVAAFVKQVAAFLAYLDRIEPPETHARSHARRELTMSLLHQAAQGIARHLAAVAGSLEDADMLQVEAMREFAVAKQQFQVEVGR